MWNNGGIIRPTKILKIPMDFHQFFFSLISISSYNFSFFSSFLLHCHQCIRCRLVLTIQINYQPDAAIFQFIILTFIYSSTCFGRFPAHHQELNDYSGNLWFYLRIVVTVVLCLWSGCHHDTKIKPEAANAVIELLMMGRKMPETC
jgi:hypothetical protein